MLYDNAFFDELSSVSLDSARIIVPILLKTIRFQSVLDVGCGRGAWLVAFQENGVETVRGIDGPHVDLSQLLISPSCFSSADLCKPLKIDEQYDLAICLEVVEHLPTRAGRALVELLTGTAPLVLFSAAVPGQGGTGHITEEWSPYWEGIFSRYEFRRLDPIRRHIWLDNSIGWWYRQNLFLYAHRDAIKKSEALQEEERFAAKASFDLLHVNILSQHLTLSGLLRQMPAALRRAFRHAMFRS